ncbi:MAG: methyltransferase domain-containing protein [Acidobacteria bacterium]|nr:methyltransferase domain-containing protein [Acidobacteriota bacterium]
MKRQFAEKYADLEEWHWWFRGRQKILESVLRREFGSNNSISIASVGCGPAEGLQWLRQFIGQRGKIVGIDAEPIHARRIAPDIEYVIGNLETPLIASGSFDAVLGLDVLEHLDNDAVGLYQAAQMVKPGGLLLITVPALPSLWGGQDVVSHHYRRYTKATLLRTFERAGLPSPRVSYFNTLLFPPIAAVRWTRRALRMAARSRSDSEETLPGLFNNLLATIFSFERHLIHRINLPVGVSLLAKLSL